MQDDASASAFADLVESQPKTGSGGTGIGRPLEFAINHFDGNGIVGGRRVIDVSGDGPENLFGPWSLRPRDARNIATLNGITINGLAILSDHPNLDQFYRTEVIVGPSAFVIAVQDIGDFKDAMRRKLLREIIPFSSAPGTI